MKGTITKYKPTHPDSQLRVVRYVPYYKSQINTYSEMMIISILMRDYPSVPL